MKKKILVLIVLFLNLTTGYAFNYSPATNDLFNKIEKSENQYSKLKNESFTLSQNVDSLSRQATERGTVANLLSVGDIKYIATCNEASSLYRELIKKSEEASRNFSQLLNLGDDILRNYETVFRMALEDVQRAVNNAFSNQNEIQYRLSVQEDNLRKAQTKYELANIEKANATDESAITRAYRNASDAQDEAFRFRGQISNLNISLSMAKKDYEYLTRLLDSEQKKIYARMEKAKSTIKSDSIKFNTLAEQYLKVSKDSIVPAQTFSTKSTIQSNVVREEFKSAVGASQSKYIDQANYKRMKNIVAEGVRQENLKKRDANAGKFKFYTVVNAAIIANNNMLVSTEFARAANATAMLDFYTDASSELIAENAITNLAQEDLLLTGKFNNVSSSSNILNYYTDAYNELTEKEGEANRFFRSIDSIPGNFKEISSKAEQAGKIASETSNNYRKNLDRFIKLLFVSNSKIEERLELAKELAEIAGKGKGFYEKAAFEYENFAKLLRESAKNPNKDKIEQKTELYVAQQAEEASKSSKSVAEVYSRIGNKLYIAESSAPKDLKIRFELITKTTQKALSEFKSLEEILKKDLKNNLSGAKDRYELVGEIKEKAKNIIEYFKEVIAAYEALESELEISIKKDKEEIEKRAEIKVRDLIRSAKTAAQKTVRLNEQFLPKVEIMDAFSNANKVMAKFLSDENVATIRQNVIINNLYKKAVRLHDEAVKISIQFKEQGSNEANISKFAQSKALAKNISLSYKNAANAFEELGNLYGMESGERDMPTELRGSYLSAKGLAVEISKADIMAAKAFEDYSI